MAISMQQSCEASLARWARLDQGCRWRASGLQGLESFRVVRFYGFEFWV